MPVTPNPIRPNPRLLDDDDLQSPRVAKFPGSSNPDPDRLSAGRPSGLRPQAQLPSPPPVQNQAQRASYEALRLALQEGYVFAALTGPAESGKTLVLDALLADLQGRALRCIRITNPDKVGAKLAGEIERVACTEAGKPENRDRHIVLVIDDAHTASDELFLSLSRISLLREPGQRVPQLLLVGRPQLWERLEAEPFEPLARRLAVRSVLPGADEPDPWASVEQELSEALNRAPGPSEPFPGADLGRDRQVVPTPPPFDGPFAQGAWDPEHPEFAEGRAPMRVPLSEVAATGPAVPPPTMYALFPEERPAASQAAAAKAGRNRLVAPLTTLFITVAAAATVLSFYDWPDILPDINWSDIQNLRVASSAPPRAGEPGPEAAPSAQPVTVPEPAKPALPSPAPVVADTAASAAAPAATTRPEVAPTAPPPAPAPVVTAAAESARAAPAASAEPARPAAAPEPPQAVPARPAPVSVAVPPQLISVLLRRGQEAVAMGDLSAARLLFQRAAEGGSAVAARSVARTYDDAFLSPAQVSTSADRQAARAWYVRAAALGDAESARRLQNMGEGQ